MPHAEYESARALAATKAPAAKTVQPSGKIKARKKAPKHRPLTCDGKSGHTTAQKSAEVQQAVKSENDQMKETTEKKVSGVAEPDSEDAARLESQGSGGSWREM